MGTVFQILILQSISNAHDSVFNTETHTKKHFLMRLGKELTLACRSNFLEHRMGMDRVDGHRPPLLGEVGHPLWQDDMHVVFWC